MAEVGTKVANHKKFVELMMKKTHFTELEVERLLDLFGKTVVGFITDKIKRMTAKPSWDTRSPKKSP